MEGMQLVWKNFKVGKVIIFMKNILLFTTNTLIYEGLKTIIRNEKDLQVSGCADSISELNEKCENYHPDYIMVDRESVTSELCNYFVNFKMKNISIILILAPNVLGKYEWEDGRISIHDTTLKIVENLRSFCQNNFLPKAQENILLTAREKKILHFWVEGETSNSIAKKLFLSTHTINKHISNIYSKMQVKNKGQAISKAIKTGMI